MNKRIFVINGSGGVGKDTFVNMVSKYVPTANFSSVDKIKEVAKSLGWTGGKTEKDRKFLSDLKLLSSEYNDMPYKSIVSRIETFLDDSINEFLFIHIREPKEIERIADDYDVTTILITNSSVKHICSNEADEGVFGYNYDLVIDNSGDLTQLNEYAELFVNSCAL